MTNGEKIDYARKTGEDTLRGKTANRSLKAKRVPSP
jgi:hypothetical protein